MLILERDRVLTRGELLDNFWDGHEVYDDALRKCVGSIRKAIGDTSRPARFIETRYGGGYRFVADVSTISAAEGQGPLTEANSRSVRSRPFLLGRRLVAVSVLLLALSSLGFYAFRSSAGPVGTEVSNAADPPRQVRSIAVMPIKNLTGRDDAEYFSDGLSESIITEMARADDLRVISRGSTFAFKGKETDPREIGQKLGVDAILEGSVQGRGETINLRVRLVSATDGSILWTSNDYEREFSTAADLQDIIACNLAAELRTELCGAARHHGTKNGIAFQEYLKGRFEWNKRTAQGIRKSIEHFDRAISADPTYALAYSGLAESYVQGIWHVPFDSSEALPKAREMALRSAALAPELAEARTALASIYLLEWQWRAAESEIERAVELNVGYSRAHHVRAFVQMISGRFGESVASIEKAAELDPVNQVVQTDRATLLMHAGRTAEAFEQWDRILTLDPNFLMAREHRSIAYEATGDAERAVGDFLEILRIKGTDSRRVDEFRRLGANGLDQIRRRELKDLQARIRKGEKVSPVTVAFYHSVLGNTDDAFVWLDKALSERSAEIVLIVSPQFKGIHSDPRYFDLISRIGLERRP